MDFENDAITVAAKQESPDLLEWTPKSYQNRPVPVPPKTITLLVKMQETAPAGHCYPFIPVVRLTRIKMAKIDGMWKVDQAILNNIRRQFRVIVLRAAETVHSLRKGSRSKPQPAITIHDFRRSAITNWSKRVNLQTLKELAGHSNVKTTVEYYASTTEDQLKLAREASADGLLEEQSGAGMTPAPPDSGKNRVA